MNGNEIREKRKELRLSQAKLSEITAIAQHELSAFELGKITLSPRVLAKLIDALSDNDRVEAVTKRKKRYQQHEFESVEVCPKRAAKATPSKGNQEYVNELEKLWTTHRSEDKPFSAISLFSGCGGFSLGFSSQGFKVRGYVELESYLRSIYRLNFPDSFEIGSDITEVDSTTLDDLATEFGEIDVIVGGPPCQGFSLSGKRDVSDPRNRLFQHYLRFVDAFRPKVAVLENVRLLTSMKNPDGGFVKDEIAKAFADHGYAIQYYELNAVNYGVPQSRERVIFVAVRSDLGLTPSIPPASHGEPIPLFKDTRPIRSFADACSDLAYIESGGKSEDELHTAVKHPSHVIKWLWDVNEGFSAHDNADPANRPPSGYNTTYKRQIWNEPGATVQTTFGMISGCRNVHPIATRSLTVREAARLQSFPDPYQFTGSLKAIRTGIGNAVPPLFAASLANHVKVVLLQASHAACKSSLPQD